MYSGQELTAGLSGKIGFDVLSRSGLWAVAAGPGLKIGAPGRLSAVGAVDAGVVMGPI